MNYIVLDLEWNQPFYAKKMIRKPVVLRGEIVQIGAVKLDENFQILDTFKIMVTPKYYSKMHKKVTRLTNITTDDLQYGFPFPIAFKHFSKWCGADYSFLTWGMEDLHMLSSNMSLHQLDPNWIPSVYDVQMIYGDQNNKGKQQISLSKAMMEQNETEYDAHDALNDARNTVRICSHLNMKAALEEYSAIKARLGIIEHYTGKIYGSRSEAMADPDILTFSYPPCGGYITCENPVKQNDKKLIMIGHSEDGKEFLVRLKFLKKGENQVTVSRMVYELTEENLEYYLERKQKSVEQAMAKKSKTKVC